MLLSPMKSHIMLIPDGIRQQKPWAELPTWECSQTSLACEMTDSEQRFAMLVSNAITSRRKFLVDAKANMSAASGEFPSVKETDHQVSMRDGHKILVRTYAAEGSSSGSSPLAILLHGGGWCTGDVSGEELLSRLAVSKLGMVVASVDYRLSPEFKFPIGPNDCYDATKWVGTCFKDPHVSAVLIDEL